jgi:exopolysaccharide production protein ExoZ
MVECELAVPRGNADHNHQQGATLEQFPLRTEQARPQLISIQILRAVAVLMVFTFHITDTPFVKDLSGASVFKMGLAGVDIFFVISGFVIYVSTRQTTITPVDFWRARFIRIAPLYYIYTLSFLALIFVAGRVPPDFAVVEIVKSFLFVPFNNSLNGQPVPLLGVGWTLNYEAFFYLVFGLGLLISSRQMRFFFIAMVFGILITMRFVLDPSNDLIVRITSPLLLEFLAGVALAIYNTQHPNERPLSGVVLIIGSTIVLLLVSVIYPTAPRTIGFGIPAVFLLQGFVFCEKWLHAPAFWIPRLLGDASYSIYLTHGIVIYAAALFLAPAIGPSLLAAIALSAAALAAGVLSYQYVESPLIQGLRNWFPKRNKGLAASAPCTLEPGADHD